MILSCLLITTNEPLHRTRHLSTDGKKALDHNANGESFSSTIWMMLTRSEPVERCDTAIVQGVQH